MPDYEVLSDGASGVSDDDGSEMGQTMATACKPPLLITSASYAPVEVECDDNNTVSGKRQEAASSNEGGDDMASLTETPTGRGAGEV